MKEYYRRAYICIAFGVIISILGIVFVATMQSKGFSIFLIVLGCIVLIIGIGMYLRPKVIKKEITNKIQAYNDIVFALLRDIGISEECPEKVKENTIRDSYEFIYVLSDKEKTQRKNDPLLYYSPSPRRGKCCVDNSQELVQTIHAILIYHYANFQPYLQQIVEDNELPKVIWEEVKPEVFDVIKEHLKEKTDKPMDFDDPIVISKMISILKPRPIHINRK